MPPSSAITWPIPNATASWPSTITPGPSRSSRSLSSAWAGASPGLDTGTHGSLLDTGNFVRALEKRQGMQSGSPDEAAYQQGWITDVQLRTQAQRFGKTD